MRKQGCSEAEMDLLDWTTAIARVPPLSTLACYLLFSTQPPTPSPTLRVSYLLKTQRLTMLPSLTWSGPSLSIQLHFSIFLSLSLLWSVYYVTNTWSMFPLQQLCICSTLSLYALSLNTHTISSFNYSSPYSNAHMIQESFLNHPIQNSTYIHLNYSLSSFPPYYVFTIRVTNW